MNSSDLRAQDHGGQVVDYHDKPPEDVALKHAEGYALIDPSQRHAPDFLKLKSRKSKNGEIVLWYINWGFPHLCIEIQDIPDLDLAREVLVFTQKISKNGGWAIYLSSTLGLDEAKRTKVESRIMVGRLSVGHSNSLMIYSATWGCDGR
jgi:hypothetical protein